jgi:hypothetical protein
LINTPTYVASPEFMSQVTWSKTGTQNELMSVPDDVKAAASDRATCAIVGTISPVRLLLEPHGNFNPIFEKNALETSKMQFQLIAPTAHPEFLADFDTSIQRIESLQKKAITEGPKAEHFVVIDGHQKALKFSWPLFEKRVRTCFTSIEFHSLSFFFFFFS